YASEALSQTSPALGPASSKSAEGVGPVASGLGVKHRLTYPSEACHSCESADQDRRDAADRSAQPLAAGSHYYLGPIPLHGPNYGPGDILWGARTRIPRQGDSGPGEHARIAD